METHGGRRAKIACERNKNMGEAEDPARIGQTSEDGAGSGRPHSHRLPLFEMRSNFFGSTHQHGFEVVSLRMRFFGL